MKVAQSGRFYLKQQLVLPRMRFEQPVPAPDQLKFVIITATVSFKLAIDSIKHGDYWLFALVKAINDNAFRLINCDESSKNLVN